MATVLFTDINVMFLIVVGFIFLTDKGQARSWNVFLWVALFTGTGILMCLYSMEWYARINCPNNTVSTFRAGKPY